MKKMISITLVGLLVGTSGAAGIVVSREKQAREVAAALAADSAAAHADSIHAATVGADSAAAADSADLNLARVDSASAAGDADSSVAWAAASAPPPVPPASRPDSLHAEVPTESGSAGPEEQRLARIFAAMRPEEAAAVLEQMSDAEVRLLLAHLRERQAAAIMSSISPERAAMISSGMIRSEKSTP